MSTISPSELSAQYDPAGVERAIYQRWLDAGVFVAHAGRSRAAGGDLVPFTIVIPPPNVTAVLHMGHGLDNVAQDLLIRWRRMAGDEALWVPGTDHAGIATQNVVERALTAEGLTREGVGRQAFVTRTEQFVERTGGRILEQLQAIGCSCDWTRTAYTLSPALSRAVREAFVRLYDAGLIYRGHRVIHWCPRCLTSLSDEEAEFENETGRLYHIRYPLADDPSRGITVATTRPETMLGDVAVAVHPEDDRYRALIGRRVRLPIAGVEIPIIADEFTDPEFGTGAVKITPAHDANDFEVGVRHALPMPVVIAPDATMINGQDAAARVPADLVGLDRTAARERVVAMLRDAGLLVNVETHEHAVRHCYRCHTVVEPRLSDQWFVRMAPLAEPALAAVRDGRIRIVPERWEGVYDHWLTNIRDWNISRQLWWGHRIPVWYCDACGGEPIVQRTDPSACPSCGGALRQDPDVLDTWFSSWLWPISTLGWPDEDAPDLRAFYPTDVLVSGPDILFFWIARMIMAGFFFIGKHPFHTVYLHGIVRDPQHRKMSKSLGNGIDPLDVVRLYGADALRYTVIAGMGLGVDMTLDHENLETSFAPGRNFTTKLWNIGRFLLGNVGDGDVQPLDAIDPAHLQRADEWILARLDAAIAACDAALGPSRPPHGRWSGAERRTGMRLNEYAETARSFVWNELADWYVESTKGRLAAGGADGEVARAVLVHVFDAALRLLHPIVPFITEALWQRLPVGGRRDGDGALLAGARWPRARGGAAERAREFELVVQSVSALRQLRAEYRVPPGTRVRATLSGASDAAHAVLGEEHALIGRLAGAEVSAARDGVGLAPGSAAHALLTDGSSVVMHLEGVVDVERECVRLRGELEELDRQLGALRGRLQNERFLARAPAAVVEGERKKAEEWSARREVLARKVEALCAG
ncbi:MAG TPA: valine--tRNA ligase [Gemmatimonadaceae bacterium]|nr:valine--tRNA ligase [Gemmatimonadaceae bacterium]